MTGLWLRLGIGAANQALMPFTSICTVAKT